MEEQTKLITLENLQQYHDLASDEVNSLISGQQLYTDTKISELKDEVDTDLDNLQLWVQGEDSKILVQANEHTNKTFNSLNLKGGEGEGSVQQTSGNASGANSSALGHSTIASGTSSHAEGEGALATGNYTHAEGYQTQAVGTGSHAEGGSTYAQGTYSHAEGFEVIANGNYEHAQGRYNVIQTGDNINRYADVVGNGTDANNRSNAYTLDWNGNAWFAGDIKTGGTSYDDAESLIKASDITFDRASEKANILRFKVSGEIVGEIPAPEVQFNGATTFVSKEIKSYYAELGLVPETVNGFAFGSSGDISGGDINYFTEENGPYMVLTNRDIINPTTLYGGNVIILKDILPSEEPSLELLTIQLDGSTVGTYDGSTETTINIEAASKEYVQELISTVTSASFEVVDELPTEGIKTNTIYLVPSQSSGLNNVYDEWVYINNKWELIGTTAIDLSNYLAKDNTTSYTPTSDYNPATKQYVDSSVTNQATIDETISGLKTFATLPESSVVPTENSQLVNKIYVDDSIPFKVLPRLNNGKYWELADIGIGYFYSDRIDLNIYSAAGSSAVNNYYNAYLFITEVGRYRYITIRYSNYLGTPVVAYGSSDSQRDWIGKWVSPLTVVSGESVLTWNREETISGLKTFATLPVSSVVPTTNNQLVNKAYVDGLVSTISTLSFQVVTELPTTDIQTNVIYLVPSTASSEQNVYDEYIYINNAWEKIGSTAIDASNYLAKNNTLAYAPTGDYNPATKKYVDDLFGQYTAQIMARLETLTNPSNYDEELSKLTGGGAEI